MPRSLECSPVTEDLDLSMSPNLDYLAVTKEESQGGEPFVDAEVAQDDLPSLLSDPTHQAGCAARFFAWSGSVMPADGYLSTCFNTASTSIGAGIIGLPAAFSHVGIAMATVYLILITAETVYSMSLLVKVARKTGLNTFEEMATALLHRHGIYFVAVIRFVHCFGACIAYVVTIGDLVTPILDETIKDETSYFRSQNGTRLLQTIFFVVFFLPLTIPRQISSLRYVSTVGIVFMLFFSFCVIAHAGTNGLKQDPRPSVAAAKTGNSALSGLGVFIFSYMTQVNAVEISAVMAPGKAKMYTPCVTLSITVCGVLYFLVGLFGYMDFGDTVKSSVLLMYTPTKEIQFLVSYIGVFIKICASYGLLHYTARVAAYQPFGVDQMTVAFWKHLIVTFSIAFVSLVGGLFIPNVGMVFDFVGGFCGGFIAFVLPALFTMYSGNWNIRSVGVVNYVSTYLTLIGGVVAIVCGTGSTIYNAVAN